jgi:hypothetical protein
MGRCIDVRRPDRRQGADANTDVVPLRRPRAPLAPPARSAGSIGLASRAIAWAVVAAAASACAAAPPQAAPPSPPGLVANVFPPPADVDAAPDDASGPVAAVTAVPAAPARLPPAVLAKDLHAPSALAVDRAALFWVDELDGDLARIPKRGGVTMTVFAGTGAPFAPGASIAVDETDIYWTSQVATASSLTRQDKNGGKPTVVASNTTAPIACVVLDETSAYWVQGPGIYKASKKGGAPQLLQGGQKGADCVALDSGHLYWSASGGEANKFADGAIVQSLKNGTQARLLVKNTEHPANVHVDDKNVYWQSADKVLKASKDTGAPEQLAQASGAVADIALDDTHVYVLTPDAVVRVSKDGGPVETVAAGLAMPTSIAVDAANVYFTTRGTGSAQYRDGTLQKVAKQ